MTNKEESNIRALIWIWFSNQLLCAFSALYLRWGLCPWVRHNKKFPQDAAFADFCGNFL